MNKKVIRDAKEELRPESLLDSVTIGELERIRIRDRLAWTCVGIIIFSVLATYTLIALAGIGMMPNFPKGFLHWLGGATIGTIVPSVLVVYKSMFPTQNSTDSSEQKEESNED